MKGKECESIKGYRNSVGIVFLQKLEEESANEWNTKERTLHTFYARAISVKLFHFWICRCSYSDEKLIDNGHNL